MYTFRSSAGRLVSAHPPRLTDTCKQMVRILDGGPISITINKCSFPQYIIELPTFEVSNSRNEGRFVVYFLHCSNFSPFLPFHTIHFLVPFFLTFPFVYPLPIHFSLPSIFLFRYFPLFVLFCDAGISHTLTVLGCFVL